MNRFALSLVNGLLALTLLLTHPSWANSEKPLMVGVAGPAINMVYSFVTRDAGFWQKYGLDARVVAFESGSILAQAALAGEVKFSISSGPATIASRTQGADSIIIAAAVNTLPYSVVAAKHITKWDQLKGKKVAISRFGSGTDTAMRMVLKKFGMDPAKDVTILQVGTQPIESRHWPLAPSMPPSFLHPWISPRRSKATIFSLTSLISVFPILRR